MLFLSYRRSDTSAYADWISEWLEESLPVSAIFYDRDSIEPADDWREHIQQIIPTCKGMLVLIGPTWASPRLFEPNDTVCQEIALALSNGIPVIPVLVEGATMPNASHLPDVIIRLSDYNALPLRVGRDNRIHDWELLRKTIEAKTGLVVRARNLPEVDKLRNTLLRLVREQIKNGQDASLKGLPFIEVGLAEQPGAIKPPYYRVYPDNKENLIRLPVDTSIIDVYRRDGHPGSLLVLGKPGAGKTTLLLELGEWLVNEAEQDTSRESSIPILLNLASWSQSSTSLHEWLTKAIQESYRLPRAVVDTITRSLPLILLLDGLDEAPADSRAACIKHMNDYLQERNQDVHIVVSSRIDEYFEVDSPLAVDYALQVQPLEPGQIDEYLARNAPVLNYLRDILRNENNKQLAGLATAPLWLNLMAVVYRDASAPVNTGAMSPETLQHYIFDQYIDNRLNPDFRPKADGLQKDEIVARHAQAKRKAQLFLYGKQDAQIWLIWMAAHLRGNRTWFLEQIQPQWVHRNWRLRLTLVAFIGFAVWNFGGLGRIITQDRWRFTWSRFAVVLVVELVGGLSIGLIFTLGGVSRVGLLSGLAGVIAGGLIVWFIIGLSLGLDSTDLENDKYYTMPNLGISRTGRNGIVIGLIGGLSFGLIFGFIGGTGGEISYRLSLGLGFGFGYVLIGGLFVGLVIGLLIGLGGGFVGGPVVALGVGLSLGFLSGLVGGLGSYLKYWVTRSLLAREHAMPHISFWFWSLRLGMIDEKNEALIIKKDPYIRFLNDMVDRNLLQKSGNGFAFIHPLLRDHFASLESPNQNNLDTN